MKIVELVLNEEDENAGVDAVSIVENPAIESDFIALNKHQVELKTIDEEKKILMGMALIPNKQIYRRNEKTNEEYYIYFSKKTIRKVSELFLKKSNQKNATLEHASKIDGMTIVESWIVEDAKMDKSALYEFNAPVGSWMISMKVDNPVMWEKVKSGEVKGFSIEGFFSEKLEASRQELESYSDYPDAVKNNAKRGIELNEKNNNKCATQTGKVRAQQLSNGEAVSEETISRMYSYLSRAKTYYDDADTNDCGNISYLLWGGLAALRWSESKLKEIGKLEAVKKERDQEIINELKDLILDYEKNYKKKRKKKKKRYAK